MADFTHAINLIRKYAGFSEKACPDLTTGAEPYTIGYGTQYYPDGSPVKRGQFCSKEKALEYLFHEVQVIDNQLAKLNLGLDDCMRQSLISFVHSIGWEPFLYSEVIDAIENEDFCAATENMAGWVFDSYHKVIGGLLDRRREEIKLFLADIDTNPWASTAILLRAFRNYVAADHQVRAIRKLEEAISPYHLAEFANAFGMDQPGWFDFDCDDAGVVFNS